MWGYFQKHVCPFFIIIELVLHKTNHLLTTVDIPCTKGLYHAYFPIYNSFLARMDMFLKTGFSSVMTEQSKQQGLCWTIKYILNCLGNSYLNEREREICLKLNPWLTSVWPQRQKWNGIHCLYSHTHTRVCQDIFIMFMILYK